MSSQPTSLRTGQSVTETWPASWPMWASSIIFLYLLIVIAVRAPFPTRYDELQHLSAIQDQVLHPTLFIDWARQKLLNRDLQTWSDVPNLINHPGLFYWLMSLIATGGPDDVLRLRLLNIALVSVGIGIAAVAACRVLVSAEQRLVFSAGLTLFPKALVVGSSINNDNLAFLASSILLSGLTSGSAWQLAAALALAGWAKLTALLAMGFVIAFWRFRNVMAGEEKLVSRSHGLIILGGILGAVPTLYNLLTFGHVLYWNAGGLREFGQDVPTGSIWNFTSVWLVRFMEIWPQYALSQWDAYSFEGPLACILFALVMAPILAATSLNGAPGRIAQSYLFGFLGLLAVHFAFGVSFWLAYHNAGTAETRYYWIFWSGMMIAATAGLGRLPTWIRPYLTTAYLVLLLSETLLGEALMDQIAP